MGRPFVAKLNPAGNNMEYCTHLGGTAFDEARDIIVGEWEAYVVGGTQSGNYPTTQDAFQSRRVAREEAFLTHIDAWGRDLVYSTFLGSSHDDKAAGVALGPSWRGLGCRHY